MKRIALSFLLLSLLGVGCSKPTSDSIGTSRFGRLVGGSVTESPIDGGWVRPHPGPFWWDQIETSQDVYDWSKTDQTVKYWESRNQAILATLWPFAQWDQERCHAKETKTKDPFGDQDVWLMSVCHVASYEEWIANVVERYDGDGVDDMPGLKYPITHWEIGNEPDLQTSDLSFFQYSPLAYEEIYRLAFDVIKQTDPNAVVLFGGMSSMSPSAQTYWKSIVENEKERAEVFNIHSIASSDQFFSKEYHEYLDALGFVNQPYWITEALVGSPIFERDEDLNAQMTMVGYVQAFANGAQRIFNVGKQDPTGGPGEASEHTFNVVVKMIDGFETVEWIGKESLIKFTFPDRDVYAAWDGVQLPLTVQGEVETIRFDGTKQKIDARKVKADVPTFVVVKTEQES